MITKFERTKIIGYRATQIALGAEPQVDITGITDAISIAEKEFKLNKIPLAINRVFPNGITEQIKLFQK